MAEQLVYGDKVSSAFCDKVRQIADRLGMPTEGANWLMTCMQFESAGTFDPAIRNKYSGATGLIQFMPSTAAGMGTSTDALAAMDQLTQLDWVEKYFKPYAGRLNSLADVYMTIFYPYAVGKDDSFVIGSQNGTASKIYSQNSGFDKNGDQQIQKIEATSTLQQRYEAGLAALGQSAPVNNGNTTGGQTTGAKSGEITYTVKSGDSLSKIANMYNVAGGYQELARYNGISNPNLIRVGQVIRIPGTSSSGGSAENKETEAPKGEIETKPNDGKSPLASSKVGLDQNSNKRPGKPTKITIHHMAGGMGAEQCAKYHRDCGREVSANYYVGTNGEICAGVSEDRRAWTSSNRDNDNQAITIETANCKGEPNWEVSDVTYNGLINLCRDICSRYGITPSYTGNSGGTLTMHKMFAATACPGPYLEGKHKDHSIERDILNGITKKDDKVSDDKKVEEPKTEQPVADTKPVTQKAIGVGSKVRIIGSRYSTGQTIPGWARGPVYTVMQMGSGKALIKELYSWVNLSDLELVDGGVEAPKSEVQEPTQPEESVKPQQPVAGTTGTLLDVELKAQQTHYTCGFASGAMAAQHYSGKPVTESDVHNACKNIGGSQANWVWCVEAGINSILKNKGKGGDYKWRNNPSSAAAFANGIKKSLDNNAPAVLRVEPNKARALYGYGSDGHYVVATGVYKKDGQIWMKLNDPYSAKMANSGVPTGSQHDAPASDIFASMKDDKYVIMHNGADFSSADTSSWSEVATGEKKQEETAAEPPKQETSDPNAVTSMDKYGYVTANDGLNVRDSGSVNGNKIGLLSKNTGVEITGQCASGWYQIKYNGSVGYVSNDFIRIGEKPSTDAVADQALANNSRQVAAELGTVGWCAKGVSTAVQRTHGFYPGGNGNQIGTGLLNSGKYKQVNLSLADALKIPGLIFSWQKTATEAGQKYGHTAISQGNGKDSSCDYYEYNTIDKCGGRTGMTVYSLK